MLHQRRIDRISCFHEGSMSSLNELDSTNMQAGGVRARGNAEGKLIAAKDGDAGHARSKQGVTDMTR
jgi:hypothetical protein